VPRMARIDLSTYGGIKHLSQYIKKTLQYRTGAFEFQMNSCFLYSSEMIEDYAIVFLVKN